MDSARQNLLLYAGVAVIIIIGIGYLLYNSTFSSSGQYNQTVSDAQMSALYSTANNQTLASTVGISAYTGLNASLYIKRINDTPLALNGKPEVLYVGAEFCPYCAASRWALILALMRFGNFTGLKYSGSSSTDVFPNTPTFTFINSSYASRYLSFVAFETETRTGKALQNLTPSADTAFSKYGGAIPFVDYGNIYVESGSFIVPGIFRNLGWGTIISQLGQPSTQISQATIAAANIDTAEICTEIGNAAPVCSQNYVRQARNRFLT